MNTWDRDPLTEAVIGAAIEVHRILGPGLLESFYHWALCREFEIRKIAYDSQQPIGVEYKGVKLGADMKIDLIAAGELIVEVKAVSELDVIHRAELLTYLRLTCLKKGLLINFNVKLLKQGLKRMVLNLEETPDMYRRPGFHD